MAHGSSQIENLPPSPDIDATLSFCRGLGATIEGSYDSTQVVGAGNLLKKPSCVDVGNSGLHLRLAPPFLALKPGISLITGDHSIQTLRPVAPLVSALRQIGANITLENHRPPMQVQGPISPGKVELDGSDSQPVSSLLIAATLLPGSTEICVQNPGEKPWIDLTLSWLDRFGVDLKREGYDRYLVAGNHRYTGFNYTVPADYSCLSFLLAAAMITQSEITIDGLDISAMQGDSAVIGAFEKMGGRFIIDKGSLVVQKCKQIAGANLDVNDMIDALPILAATACFANSKTRLFNGSIARKKESDRIHTMANELKKMGAHIDEHEDGLTIYPSPLTGCTLNSHKDHRIAMSLAVAGLKSKGKTIVKDTACIAKSYPSFVKDLKLLGAHLS
jgi:3-phosphoshikimate 1-carboxyvinyltransferase